MKPQRARVQLDATPFSPEFCSSEKLITGLRSQNIALAHDTEESIVWYKVV